MTFNETLAALPELVGQRVSVSAAGILWRSAHGPDRHRHLAEGTELLHDRADGGEECIYPSLEEDRGAGLRLYSSVFRSAAWEGSVLRINLGTVALRLERESD